MFELKINNQLREKYFEHLLKKYEKYRDAKLERQKKEDNPKKRVRWQKIDPIRLLHYTDDRAPKFFTNL